MCISSVMHRFTIGLRSVRTSLSLHFWLTIRNDFKKQIDKDEVSLRRTIGLKKDEYFLNKKHYTYVGVSMALTFANCQSRKDRHWLPVSLYFLIRFRHLLAIGYSFACSIILSNIMSLAYLPTSCYRISFRLHIFQHHIISCRLHIS